MSGACFKDIINSESLMFKHRLLCKWCQTAAQNIAPYKIPCANNSTGADREEERQTFPSYSHVPCPDPTIQAFVGQQIAFSPQFFCFNIYSWLFLKEGYKQQWLSLYLEVF